LQGARESTGAGIASIMTVWHSVAMPIVAARRYADGHLAGEVALDGQPRAELPPRSFDWIGLESPTPEEMELARSQFALHPLAIEDALHPLQAPKVEVYGRQLFIIARTAMLDGSEKIEYGQTALFLGPDFILTARIGSPLGHGSLRTMLEADPERLAEGADFVAHALLDLVVDHFQPIMEQLEDSVQAMEDAAINAFPEQSTIRRIFRLRRQLRRFLRIVGPMEEVCERLATTDLPAIDPSARIWFRDVLDHVRRTLARVDGLKETLASIVETAGLLEAHRQGAITRQLAAWAAILAVPTAIAGIYGMNFEHMPELRQTWGYPAVLAAIAAICGGLFWRFRRIGWL
jgi:magnesium transporter